MKELGEKDKQRGEKEVSEQLSESEEKHLRLIVK